MDYEKLYKEALERARELATDLPNGRNDRLYHVWDLENIFPELAKSEDERIRKALIELVRMVDKNPIGQIFGYGDIKYSDMIAWLEKQAEQKPCSWKPTEEQFEALDYAYNSCSDTEIGNYYEGVLGTLIDDLRRFEKQGQTFTKKDVDDAYLKGVCDTKQELENQGEPKWCHHEVDFSDCSEEYRKAYYDGWNNCNMQHSQCKSELDDVIKCLINGMKLYYEDNEEATWGTDKWYMPVKHIIEVLERQVEQKPVDKVEPKFHEGEWITNGDYTWKIVEVKPLDYILQSQDGNIVDDTIFYVDEQFHLWTIEDAKDGDVLYHKAESGIEYIVMGKHLNEHNNIDSYFRYNSINGFGIDIPSVLSAKYDSITPATKEQRDLLFQKMKEAGYEWNADKKGLKKIDARENLTLDGDLMEADCMIVEKKYDWSKEDEQYLLVCKNALAKYQTTDKWDAGIISHWLENRLKSLKRIGG